MGKYNIVIEKDSEGNLVGSVPAIQGAYSEAKDIQTLLKNIKEVIEVWEDVDKKKIVPLEFIGVQTIEV